MRTNRTTWVIVGFILLLLSIVVTVAKAPVAYWQQAEVLGVYLESSGRLGQLLIFFAATLAISFGLPRQLFAFVFGFAFGAQLGVIWALITAVSGCALTYTFARYLFAARFKNRYTQIQSTLSSWVEEDLFLKIVILRFQPLGTNLLTNVCAGLVPLPASKFLLASAIGFVPQSAVFSMLGSGVRLGSKTQMWLSLLLLAVSILLALVVFKRAKRES